MAWRFALAFMFVSSCPTWASERVPLAEELNRLREAGLNIVYSPRLVLETYLVQPQPNAKLIDQAHALLASFPLALKLAPPDTWYVVRRWKETQPGQIEAIAHAPPMEEVLVTSKRRLVRAWSATHHMDGRELNAIPVPGGDLLRAVNQLPGFSHSGVTARQYPRGGNQDESLYLIDGTEIVEPFHFADFEALFSTVNPGLIGAINVYHSGFPAQYGSRLSSVIDMDLVPPSSDFSGEMDLNVLTASAYAQGRIAAFGWLVSARRSTLDLLDSRLTDRYGEPSFHDEFARFNWHNEHTHLQYSVLTSNDELVLRDETTGERATADFHNVTMWVDATHALPKDIEASWRVSYHSLENDRTGVLDRSADGVGSLVSIRDHSSTTIGLQLTSSRQERVVWTIGVNGQRQHAEFDSRIDVQYGALSSGLQNQAGRTSDRLVRRNGTQVSAFVSARLRLSDRWMAEAGARYDNQDVDPVHTNQWSPRLELRYGQGTPFSAYLNLGRYTQPQQLFDMQVDDGLTELSEPQVANQASVGIEWSPHSNWELRADVYWRDTDDARPRFENVYNRWVLLPELHADRVQIRPSRARAYGLDTSIAFSPSEAIRAHFSWSLAKTEERVDGRWQPRPWDQRHAVRLGADWQGSKWRFAALAHYHSGWPTSTRRTSLTQPLYDTELPSYLSVNIQAARRWHVDNTELEAYLNLSNATLRDNVGGYVYDIDSRRSRNLLPAVPTLGLRITW